MKKRDNFNVQTVELESSNLIEASAGTGKTFSIAILVLRLIIEKNIDLRQILMVTFTKAAVAELESRIREFIREAYRHVQDSSYKTDDLIQSIIEDAIQKVSKSQVTDRLKGATLFLDETSVFTIHSFCQKTLTEFAFETHQLFGSDVLDNQTEIIEKAVNEYWRKRITIISVDKLELLQEVGLSKAVLTEVVQKALRGKRFIYKTDLDIDTYFTKAIEQHKVAQNLFDVFIAEFMDSKERTPEYIKSCGTNPTKKFLSVCKDAEAFLNQLLDKKRAKYVEKFFPQLLERALVYQEQKEKSQEMLSHILYTYYGRAISVVKKHVDKIKQRLSILTYDDLIVNLHKAVKGPQQDTLKYELQKKYKAVFIDEFQDTDRLQYEIFDILFGKSSILFYIGDPKQAIYSFRGADIDTYIKASNSTNRAFTMSRNFRSTDRLIEAMNHFFSIIPNPFFDENIKYEKVKNGATLSELTLEGQVVKPFAYAVCKGKNQIIEQTVFHILDLLINNYQIENRRLRPSDIGVLVRKKQEGIDIKKALDALRVPSVTIDDTKVLESSEAKQIFYVLEAILEPSRSNINRALLSPLTKFKKQFFLSNAIEEEILNFKNLLKDWQNKSVLSALAQFLRLYSVKRNLLSEDNVNGERILTNILQIMELLHRKELEEKLLPTELLNYLHNVLDGKSTDGDEYTQRIESDEDAVNIVTIHKSKGLAYNIVFAPFLDLSNKSKTSYSFIEYKDADLNSCFSLYKTEEENLLYETQTEKENRRLIYVALTRAVYKNYVFQNIGKAGKGSITNFISKLQENSILEELGEPIELAENYKPTNTHKSKEAKVFSRNIQNNWSVLSYSRLSEAHISFMSKKEEIWENSYDEFVFSRLPKGPFAGNFMHDLFENADFTDSNFEDLIATVSQKYLSVYDDKELTNYNLLITNVLNARYTEDAFLLSDISRSCKLPELEFYFNLSNFSPEKINTISHLIDIESSKIKQGAMYGFIDLFFEHNGKYYILDWKSNFLGNSLEDYTQENISLAMRGNNYHLQYLIYTVAVKRFLSLKIQNFDYDKQFGGVLYVFLRGCREGQNTGVFYTKPPENLINRLDQLL